MTPLIADFFLNKIDEIEDDSALKMTSIINR